MTEEYDDEMQSRQNYQELLQYVTLTHTTKTEGNDHKKDAASGRGVARFSTAPFGFDELVDYHMRGMTFRKLPEKAVDKWSTRYLVMDFDDKKMPGCEPLHVTTQELDQIIDMCQLTARYTPSGDLSQYHYHLFILLDKAVNAKEYKQVNEDIEKRLNNALAFLRGRDKLPRLTDPNVSSQSTFFAPRQDEVRRIEKKTWFIDDDGRHTWGYPPEHIERTNDFPMPRKYVERIRIDTVPLSTAQFARWAVIHGILAEERILDIEYNYRNMPTLPYMRKGASKDTKKIPIGERNEVVKHFGFCLYSIARVFNLWLTDHGHEDKRFTDSDIKNSFKQYVYRGYETGDSFVIEQYVDYVGKMCTKYASLTDRAYCELMKTKYPHHYSDNTKATSRRYVAYTANDIVKFFRKGDTVQFGSVAERDRILRDKSVSINTVKSVARSNGLVVTTEHKSKGGARSGAGRKTSKTANDNKAGRGRPATVSWDTLSNKGHVVDGVFYYTVKLSPTETKFCSLKNIKIRKDDSIRKSSKKNNKNKNNEK